MDIRLRDVVDDDLEILLAYEHDPEAVARSRFVPREREAFLTHWRTRVLASPDSFVQAILVEGEVAGSIVAWDAADDGRRFTGYWLGRSFWGRGVGTAAMRAFLERERGRPLYADPHVGNTASCRLLERCGFVREGTDRDGDDEHAVYVLR